MSARMPIKCRRALARALSRLHAVSSPTAEGIGIEPEHRAAVRAYVQTWITPLIDAVLAHGSGVQHVELFNLEEQEDALRCGECRKWAGITQLLQTSGRCRECAKKKGA